MSVAIEKLCSRCKVEITCYQNSIADCPCAKITLSKRCQEFLRETEYDCLCNTCLLSIDKLVEEADNGPTQMTEDVHYYLEDGMLVFKELHHIQRGYCCKSGCRHCAFGFTPQD